MLFYNSEFIKKALMLLITTHLFLDTDTLSAQTGELWVSDEVIVRLGIDATLEEAQVLIDDDKYHVSIEVAKSIDLFLVEIKNSNISVETAVSELLNVFCQRIWHKRISIITV